jgi:hypothetical protein
MTEETHKNFSQNNCVPAEIYARLAWILAVILETWSCLHMTFNKTPSIYITIYDLKWGQWGGWWWWWWRGGGGGGDRHNDNTYMDNNLWRYRTYL